VRKLVIRHANHCTIQPTQAIYIPLTQPTSHCTTQLAGHSTTIKLTGHSTTQLAGHFTTQLASHSTTTQLAGHCTTQLAGYYTLLNSLQTILLHTMQVCSRIQLHW